MDANAAVRSARNGVDMGAFGHQNDATAQTILRHVGRARVRLACRGVQFLRRRDTDETAAWWAAVADFPSSAPGLVSELLRGPSVVCERVEGEQALAWARAHPAWSDDTPAVDLVDPNRADRSEDGD